MLLYRQNSAEINFNSATAIKLQTAHQPTNWQILLLQFAYKKEGVLKLSDVLRENEMCAGRTQPGIKQFLPSWLKRF